MTDLAPIVSAHQPSFQEFCPVRTAVEALSEAGIEARGAIFTRREVVDFILDLVGYTPDQPLHQLRLLEPSFGDGDFLIPAIERLLAAWRGAGTNVDPLVALEHSIRAVELHRSTFERTKARIVGTLIDHGIPAQDATALSDRWLIHADFLLAPLDGPFNVIVGNPPYVRQELIPDALIAEYRSRYHTIYDRADLYIPFIERSLMMLAGSGNLGFICADRWMKNRYGSRLRQYVANKFHLKIYVDMVNTAAFHTDVIAYPAITIITREKAGSTRVAHRPNISAESMAKLAEQLLSIDSPTKGGPVRELTGVAVGAEPWILESLDQLALVRRLEATFPTVEEAACKVGIGVATGADSAFIAPFDELDVETDRKLPLVMTRDILTGTVMWRGLGVINPFSADGGLVKLEYYPRLKAYLEARKAEIAGRHVAQKVPANWYRTIDRIYPAIGGRPKLLIPDIKGEAHVVYEHGRLYPHHNLYYIISDVWDLKALQAVLLSGIARLFVSTYSTKMRGGYLRFQAQYLRRIRVPHWKDVSPSVRRSLIEAADHNDIEACNRATFALYGLNAEEKVAIGGNGA